MFVFIDESGDLPIPGTKQYFALSAIVFETEERKQQMEHAIGNLRQEWGKKLNNNEFKFSKLDRDDRLRFFEHIGGLAFKHSCCILEKAGLRGQWLDRTYAYERVINELVDDLTPYFREVDSLQPTPLKIRVVFDQHDDPEYKRHLRAKFIRLRSKDGSGMVKSVKPGRSASSGLLQLADMVCGANRWDSSDYRNYIAAQCCQRRMLP
jgi:hypothetical protein